MSWVISNVLIYHAVRYCTLLPYAHIYPALPIMADKQDPQGRSIEHSTSLRKSLLISAHMSKTVSAMPRVSCHVTALSLKLLRHSVQIRMSSTNLF